MKRKNQGFTIIELVIVIGIIGAIALLLLPALGKTRGHAHMVKCMNNMRELSMAAMMYASDHNGEVPDVADPNNLDASLANSDYVENEEVFICPRDTRTDSEFGTFKTSYTATAFSPTNLFTTGASSRILYIESDDAGVLTRDQITDLSFCTPRHGSISNIAYASGNVASYNEDDDSDPARTIDGAPDPSSSEDDKEPMPPAQGEDTSGSITGTGTGTRRGANQN